jgi:hypothetical protein
MYAQIADSNVLTTLMLLGAVDDHFALPQSRCF